MTYQIPQLPLSIELETKTVLRHVIEAHKALAELKGVAGIIPNQHILINTLGLQEAKDSSAIENIITTNDELYESDAISKEFVSIASKEVHSYAAALKHGYDLVNKDKLLTSNMILDIQSVLIENKAGFRQVPGTCLKSTKCVKNCQRFIVKIC